MKRLLPLFAVCVFAAAAHAAPDTISSVPKTPPTLKPAPDGSRFLFVMDMSAAMKATDAANRQALFDLAFTGFDSQMRHGDTFGLWLFSDEVRAGEFPLQVWDSENPLPIASRAAQFVRAQKYSGKARLDEIMTKLLALVRTVRDVHVVLITTGEQPISGTPLDANINEACARKQAERKQAQKPLVIVLNARDGQIASASVTLPGQYVELPERPVAIAVTVSTNAPPSNAAPRVTIPPAPKTDIQSVKPAVPPTKVWTPSVAAVPATNDASASRIQAVQTVAQTNPVAAPLVAQETSVVAVASDPAPVPPVTEPTPPAAILAPEPVPVAAREPSPATVPVYVIQPPVSPTLLLAIGATLLAACLVLLVIVLRRLRPERQGSVITQSMDRR